MIDIKDLKHRINFLENNFKQYVAGNTYNGIVLTVTGSNGWINIRTVLRPYRLLTGEYWLFISGRGYTSGFTASVVLTLAGVGFQGSNGAGTSLSYRNSVGTYHAGTIAVQGGAGANTLYMWTHSASNTDDYWQFTCDLELNSWPTWAYSII